MARRVKGVGIPAVALLLLLGACGESGEGPVASTDGAAAAAGSTCAHTSVTDEAMTGSGIAPPPKSSPPDLSNSTPSIAYSSNEIWPDRFFIVDLASQDRQQVTDLILSSVDISPGGDRLVYTVFQGPPDPDKPGIFTASIDGTEMNQLTSDPTDADPSWAPSGDVIAFNRGSSVWVMGADGSNQRPLVGIDASEELLIPTRSWWAPNGRSVAVVTAGGLRVVSASTGEVLASLPWDPAGVGNLEWSPDGSQIAFEYGDAIAVSHSDGSRGLEVTLPEQGAQDLFPTWAPDGQSILFVNFSRSNGESGDGTMCVLELEDVRLREVPSSEVDYAQPASWSPDGSKIAFTAAGPNFESTQILVVDEDGSNETALTEGNYLHSLWGWVPPVVG